jgi:hypothetical protein
MRRRRLQVVSGSMAAGLVLLIASCSDAPTGAIPNERTDDFVAEGMVYNQIWAPATSGLRLVATSERLSIVSRRAGSVHVEGRDMGFRIADSATARIKRFEGTSPLSQAIAAPGSVAKLVLKARKVASKRVDGKNVAVAAVPDDNRASGRPPRAIILLEDDRIAAITEYTWGRRGGAWRAVHTRTTFLDEHGQLGIVFDQDASRLAYRNGRVGVLDQLRGGVGQLLPAMGRLVQPDVLYAATGEEGVCITEGLAAAAAGAAVIAAGYYVQAARAALAVATLGLTTAMAGCMVGAITCPALEIAIAAEAAAAANLRFAQAALAGAILTAAAADYALSECWRRWRERQDKPDETVTNPSGGGSESGCGDDGEEWCQWTLSWPDGVLSVHRDYCWCEGKDREYEL